MIATEEEYEAALGLIAMLFDAEPGSDEERQLDELVDAVVAYEDEHYPMDKPSLLARLAFWWDQRGRWKLRRLWLFGKRGWQ